MTKPRDMPLSGYALERVYSLSQCLEHKEPATDDPAPGVNIGWDWRIAPGDGITFEVKMSASVEPSEERDDLIRADVIGLFHMVDETPSVPVSQFVRLHAAAILLPYLRQLLSTLTSMSYHGPYYLPAVNVSELMNDFDENHATGARQLKQLLEAQKTSDSSAHDGEAKLIDRKNTTKRKRPSKGQGKHAALKRTT